MLKSHTFIYFISLYRLTIIGVLLSFRHMLQEVLYTSMVDHAPFLMSSIKDFSDNVPGGSDKIYINEMAASAGGYISKSNSPSRQGVIPRCIFSAKFEENL